MNRFLGLAALALLLLQQTACSANTQGEQQTLVDRATLTVQEMMTQNASQDPKNLLRRAKGVMICPRIFKAGFFFGGEGGKCVLLGRAGNGTWSYPAFYTIGSGSFGFQFGIADSQLMMMILTEKGLNAVLDSQVKLGATAGIAVATVGAGIGGSTTAAVGADIVGFASSRGLFGGVALEGSVMSSDTEWNQFYYGTRFAARQLVMQMQGSNPGADPLRDLLTRFGTRTSAPAQPQPGYAPAYPAYQGTGQPPAQAPNPQAPYPQAPNPQAPYPQAPQPQPGQPQAQAPYQLPTGSGSYPPAAGERGPVQEQSLAPPSR
ncbi:MAG: YSC84-related protein [Rhodopila sp.]